MKEDYREQQNLKLTLRLRKIQEDLPEFFTEFFRGIQEVTSVNTRLSYAYDFKIFFTYLKSNSIYFSKKEIKKIEVKDLNKITAEDIESYLEYLTIYYVTNEEGIRKRHKNSARGKSRKLASLRTLFKYYIKRRKIKNNPSEIVDMPKIHDKNIIRLEKEEVKNLLIETESGENLNKFQKKFHAQNKSRDLAIIILLLGTGIRISELVGIDIENIDFKIKGIKITRKGGNESVIYFGEEVDEALQNYLEDRKKKIACKGHENALFLSIQNKRLTDRAIQNLVKKYSQLISTFKNISPHKLRSTYGTNLYRQTRDIYLVADVLGHKDVNTTKKHYAQMDDERRKDAAKYIKLKE